MLNDWLVKRSQMTPDKTALVDAASGEKITYLELNKKVTALAAYLAKSGVKKGDRVAFLDYNSIFCLLLLFALPRLGAVFMPLNYRLSVRELNEILADASPSRLFFGEEWASTAGELKGEGLKVQGNLGVVSALGGSGLQPDYEGILPVDEEDPWMILYTGGTTGKAKGAVLSHRMITWNAVNTIISWGLIPSDVVVMAMPFFHTGGLNVFTLPLLHLGGTVVVMKSFDPEVYLQVLQREKGTIMFMVPTMYQLVADSPSFPDADFSSVRICISGGSSCPEKIYHRYWDRGLLFRQGYGLTEGGPNCFALADAQVKEKIGSVGRPTFFCRARVVDEEGRKVPPGEIGELIMTGPHLFSRYWRNPEATAAMLKEGWLHTGDLVRHDAEGFYYIVDRKKDMFISGGENIYPFEIEDVLNRHGAVREAAVIGIPHDKWGEVGRAYVVFKEGYQVSKEELADFCRAHLARYKVPREFVILRTLPKSPAGKILKRELAG